MNKAFVAILVAAVLYLTANAEIKVAIHKDSCNSASLNPAYSSRKSIEAQLTINGKIKGTAVADSDFTSANLANYDVIYLGCGGKDTELDALSTSAAQAIVNFVNNGGGLVLSATSATAFSAARSVLEPIMPVPSNSMAWAKTSTQNTVPLLTVTQQHYITSHAITSQYVAPLAFAFYVQSQPKSDWTSIADVSANTAECCLGFSSCDDSYCDPYVSQGILVKQFSSGGRVAYINFPFCGYEMFGPHNLRAGNINQLFLNMFYWTSGKCKGAANECNNHGACTGLNTCSCESGWDGEYCNQPSCNDVQCKNGGTCVAPNTCSCVGHFRPPDCSGCVYPYAGSDCTSFSQIQDPSFELTPNSFWQYSDTSVVVESSGTVTPKNETKMLAFTGSKKTFTVAQNLYIMNSDGASPYLSFYYRTGSSLGSSTLQILVNNTPVWTSPASVVNDWTNVRVTLANYSSDDGIKNTLTIKATMASTTEAFYVDLVENAFPVCDPECHNGVCILKDNGEVGCVCDFYHAGPTCDDPRCGDGRIDYPEACDDGNDKSGDGCSSTCQVEDGWQCDDAGRPCTDICGDGRTVSDDEDACDDGNFINGDGCNSQCKVERGYTCTKSKTSKSVCSVMCGDGLILGFEACDVARNNTAHAAGCSSDCSKITDGWDCTKFYNKYGNDCIEVNCGDGRRTSNEECDDGNNDDGDGCSHDCKIERGWYRSEGADAFPLSIMRTRCGDGITMGEEKCDSTYKCTTECVPEPGYICTVDPDTLKSDCEILCGDSVVIFPEQCDDGNTKDGDGCSSKCKVESGYHCVDKDNCVKVEKNVCGDGVTHSPETCDIGSHSSPGCKNCVKTSGWECDSESCWTVCGDGILTEDEYCDCGPSNPFCAEDNGCVNCKSLVDESMYICKNLTFDGITYSNCRTRCGDGIRTANEQCDDNNTRDGDGCSRDCKLEAGWTCDTPLNGVTVCTSICGDKITVKGETCYEGEDTLGCINCQLEYGYVCNKDGYDCHCVHGDGKKCKEEECDDGDPDSKGCVQGKVASGWECFNYNDTPSICIEKVCGNGEVSSDEQCDDGNTVDGDGCSSTCKLESDALFQCTVSPDRKEKTICKPRVCGDGVITDDEQCDDGNLVDGDGCSSKCVIEKFYRCLEYNGKSVCFHQCVKGDGYHNEQCDGAETEECDDGNLIDGDGCSSNCTVEPGYACEDNSEGLSSCHPVVCGDGKRECDEKCDDGNTDNGDGCSYDCKIEAGYKCYENNKKSTCRSYCGDGMKSANEECDDGNFVGGDGCSPTCKIEHGYSCFVDYLDEKCKQGSCISQCFATCGDGIVAQEEECDDGNSFQGDGCYNCKLESEDWRCKGEPSECILRKCTLADPEATLTHILCAGSAAGVIDVTVNTTEEFVTKVWKESASEPSSFQSTTHYTNLVAGNYFVKAALVGFMDCTSMISVTIQEPAAFSNMFVKYETGFGWPSSCSNADGFIKWNPKGGVKPYKFYFANRTVSESGEFNNVNITEFLSGPPTMVDANNCTRTMEFDPEYWPGADSCKQEVVPYLKEGSIALAAAFVVAIVLGISYSCWSSKRQVPKNWKGGKGKK